MNEQTPKTKSGYTASRDVNDVWTQAENGEWFGFERGKMLDLDDLDRDERYIDGYEELRENARKAAQGR